MFESKCPKCKGPLVKRGKHDWCEKCQQMFCGQPCEVFSRVVGYFRPVENWNKGKQSEFRGRKPYRPIAADGKLAPEQPRLHQAPLGGRWAATV